MPPNPMKCGMVNWMALARAELEAIREGYRWGGWTECLQKLDMGEWREQS